jgi:uncharacterized membrane protein
MKINLEFSAYTIWDRKADGVIYDIEIELNKQKYTTPYTLSENLKINSLKLKEGESLKLNFKLLEKDILEYLKEDTLLEFFSEKISEELYNELGLNEDLDLEKFYKNYKEPKPVKDKSFIPDFLDI